MKKKNRVLIQGNVVKRSEEEEEEEEKERRVIGHLTIVLTYWTLSGSLTVALFLQFKSQNIGFWGVTNPKTASDMKD